MHLCPNFSSQTWTKWMEFVVTGVVQKLFVILLYILFNTKGCHVIIRYLQIKWSTNDFGFERYIISISEIVSSLIHKFYQSFGFGLSKWANIHIFITNLILFGTKPSPKARSPNFVLVWSPSKPAITKTMSWNTGSWALKPKSTALLPLLCNLLAWPVVDMIHRWSN